MNRIPIWAWLLIAGNIVVILLLAVVLILNRPQAPKPAKQIDPELYEKTRQEISDLADKMMKENEKKSLQDK